MVLRAMVLGSNQAGFQLQGANSLAPKKHYAYMYGVGVYTCVSLSVSICYEELKSLRCKLWHW